MSCAATMVWFSAIPITLASQALSSTPCNECRLTDYGFAMPYRLLLMATPQTRVEKLGNIGPNWFASVMGTGIVATAGATLPVHVPGLRGDLPKWSG